MKQRFEYAENSRAGFVELHKDCIPTNAEFFEALKNAPDVERVEWKSTKTSQGNVGNHRMEQNVMVYVSGFAKRALEFELTRYQHMEEMRDRNFTVTAAFKEPPVQLHHDAWRILLHVVHGRELLPVHARDYAQRSLARSGVKPLEADDVLGEPPAKKSRIREASPKHGPGSASSATGGPSQPVLAGAARPPAPAAPRAPSPVPMAVEKPVECVSGVEPGNAPASAKTSDGDWESCHSVGELPAEVPEDYDDVDWDAEQAEESCGVEVAPAVLEEMAEEVPAEAAALSARRADTLEVRAALCHLPAFMNWVSGQAMPRNEGLAQVRAMKGRG